MDDTKLMQCPFCKKDARSWRQGIVRKLLCACSNDECGAYFTKFTPDEWNTRTSDADLPPLSRNMKSRAEAYGIDGEKLAEAWPAIIAARPLAYQGDADKAVSAGDYGWRDDNGVEYVFMTRSRYEALTNTPPVSAPCPDCKGTGYEVDVTTEEGIDDCEKCNGHGVVSAQGMGEAVIGFDMAAPEGDMSCLQIGVKNSAGGLDVQHCVYGDEAEALYRALNSVPALRAALSTQTPNTPASNGVDGRMDGNALQQALWRIRCLREGIEEALSFDTAENKNTALKNCIDVDNHNASQQSAVDDKDGERALNSLEWLNGYIDTLKNEIADKKGMPPEYRKSPGAKKHIETIRAALGAPKQERK